MANTSTVDRFGIYELTINHDDAPYLNPWEDVNLSARFTGPAGFSFPVDGFYYNTDQWKVRFSPPGEGNWTWQLTFTTPANTFGQSGSFNVGPSDHPGYVRRHPTNPFRLVFEDGSLFNAIGISDCILVRGGSTSPDNWGFDGPDSGGGPRRVAMPVYMAAYGKSGAGFNLFRWSVDNCSFALWKTISTDGNRYGLEEGLWGDQIVEALRANGFRIYMGIFGFNPSFIRTAGDNLAEQEAVKRYIRYVVARYGAYVDFWELMNEAPCGASDNSGCRNINQFPRAQWDKWIKFAADYLRSIDNFDRMITTSWERPALPEIDFTTPHWYEREPEDMSDLRTSQKINEVKGFGKPVIFGEQGNLGTNWDDRSALRMRLRSWTAFFEEGVLIFWNTSSIKTYLSMFAANIYLGPEERDYIRVLQDFTANVDPDVVRFTLIPSRNDVRAYGLKSSTMVLGYFHHFADHVNPVSTTVTLDLARNGTVTWIDPATGRTISSFSVTAGRQTLTTPEFVVDLAIAWKSAP